MMTCNESIVKMLICDTEQGKLLWSCGSHSDLYSATGPDYRLEEIPGSWFGIDFRISIITTAQWSTFHIGYWDWRRLRRLMGSKNLVGLPAICEKLNI